MTAPTLSLTESQTLMALRSFLLAVLPTGTEVVKGQDNRVPEPRGPNFVTMTPILRERMATNTDSYVDGFPSAPGTKTALQPVKVTVQVDIHGPASADNAQTITTLFRDDFAADSFIASGLAAAPLYCADPRQMPFTNGEQQVEARWTIDMVMQANPVVTVPQDFADALAVGIVEVDVTYRP